MSGSEAQKGRGGRFEEVWAAVGKAGRIRIAREAKNGAEAITEKARPKNQPLRFALWALLFMEDDSCLALASVAKSIHSQG